jgi:uncharacterized membrane protein
MSLSQVHQALATASLIFSLIITGYGLWLYLRKRGIDGNFWGALAAGELLFLAQMVLGLVLLAGGLRPARTAVHILYGALLVMVLPGAYIATRAADSYREAGLYAAAGLFLAGVSLRAMTTGTMLLPGG